MEYDRRQSRNKPGKIWIVVDQRENRGLYSKIGGCSPCLTETKLNKLGGYPEVNVQLFWDQTTAENIRKHNWLPILSNAPIGNKVSVNAWLNLDLNTNVIQMWKP